MYSVIFFFYSHAPSAFFFECYVDHRVLHLSLHDALPIYHLRLSGWLTRRAGGRDLGWIYRRAALRGGLRQRAGISIDRKSTRLNSSHGSISYAVFCLKKKNNELSIHVHQCTVYLTTLHNS